VVLCFSGELGGGGGCVGWPFGREERKGWEPYDVGADLLAGNGVLGDHCVFLDWKGCSGGGEVEWMQGFCGCDGVFFGRCRGVERCYVSQLCN
jgi:hypothetical protein